MIPTTVFLFFIVGSCAAGVHLGVEYLLVQYMLFTPLAGNILAFLTAMCVGYVGHRYITFQAKERKPSHIVAMRRYCSVALFGFALNQGLFFVFLRTTHVPYLLALFFVLLIVPPITYILSKQWVFAKVR